MQTKKIYQIFKAIQLERKRVSSVRDCGIPANLYIYFLFCVVYFRERFENQDLFKLFFM